MRVSQVTSSEKCNILLKLLMKEVGTDRALMLYNKALEDYCEIQTAIRTVPELERR